MQHVSKTQTKSLDLAKDEDQLDKWNNPLK